MHRLGIAIVSALSIAAFAQSASAADLPRKAPAVAPMPMAPAFTWTGFYVGLHAGWGFTSSSDATVSDNFLLFDPVSLDQGGNGVVGGLQLGYNWQFAPNWLIGIEGDFSGTGIRETATAPVTFGGAPAGPGFNHIAERDVRWLATLRARLGFTSGPWLLYVTGGGAWGGIDYTAGPNYAGLYNAVTFDDTASGWTVGGGFEYAFNNNWTARLEYLYIDLDDVTFHNAVVPVPAFSATTTWENRFNVVRVGVNYKF
ncbi:MAG TPA: outer membrane protein [Pseudolabrys sp.]|nr:outer membrane protein [Pseudolabrys sp.]